MKARHCRNRRRTQSNQRSKNAHCGRPLSENGGVTAAEFCELKRTFLREMEKAKRASDEREGAEVAAAIEFFARTGQSPPGYEISG